MKAKLKNIPILLAMISAILAFLILLINTVPTTMGRYITSFGGELRFSINDKPKLELDFEDWVDEVDRKTLAFSVSCADGEVSFAHKSSIRVRLYIPEANVLPSKVVMNRGEEEYTAVLSELPIGTTAYRAYGEGKICCFYNADGEEITFDVLQETQAGVNATLALIGDQIDTSGVRVVVDSING